MKLDSAKKIAADFMKDLQPFCHKINVVGQISQLRKNVGLVEIICNPYQERAIVSEALFPGVSPIYKETYCRGFLSTINASPKLHGTSGESRLIIIRLKYLPARIYIVPLKGWGLAQLQHTSNSTLWKYVLERLANKGLHFDKKTLLLHWNNGKAEDCHDETTLFKLAEMPAIPLYLREHWCGFGTIADKVLLV